LYPVSNNQVNPNRVSPRALFDALRKHSASPKDFPWSWRGNLFVLGPYRFCPIGCHDRPWSYFEKLGYGGWLRLTESALIRVNEPMPSISAIARDWHVSRPYVSRCVNHRGCPKTSLQEAQEWRECYASTRANQRWIAQGTDNQKDNNSQEDTVLIPFAVARDMAWRGYDAILALVDELPKNVAVQCNPSNPQIALAALEAECTYIACNAYEAYAAWSKGGPHITTATDTE